MHNLCYTGWLLDPRVLKHRDFKIENVSIFDFVFNKSHLGQNLISFCKYFRYDIENHLDDIENHLPLQGKHSLLPGLLFSQIAQMK